MCRFTALHSQIHGTCMCHELQVPVSVSAARLLVIVLLDLCQRVNTLCCAVITMLSVSISDECAFALASNLVKAFDCAAALKGTRTAVTCIAVALYMTTADSEVFSEVS